MKKFIAVLFPLFLIACHDAAHHTDLTEYGYRGHIKSVTSYSYDSILLKNGEWIAVDSNNWVFKTVYDYNAAGNITRMLSITRSPENNQTDYIVVNEFTYDKGIKKGKQYDKYGKQDGAITYNWKGTTSYKATCLDNDGKLFYTSETELTNGFREKSTLFKLYQGNDTILYGHRLESTVDKDNRLIKGVMTNLKTKEVKETLFTYKEFDKTLNPVVVYRSYANADKPYLVMRRTYEYF